MSDDKNKIQVRTDCAELPAIDLAHDAILLDVDGTIIDIAATPHDVRVPESLRRTLRRLNGATGGALALISGRTLSALDELFLPMKTAAIGCHGAQIRRSADSETVLRVPPLSAAVRNIAADVRRLEPLVRVEDKVFTLACHFRQARDREEPLVKLLRERLEPHARDLVLLHGKSVVEIKSRDFNKGEALRDLMRFPPFAGRRPIFFGDDKTDEDVFEVLPDFGGMGVSVGRHALHASVMVQAPGDVRRWLSLLADTAWREGDGPGP